jgi:hypothetical protein
MSLRNWLIGSSVVGAVVTPVVAVLIAVYQANGEAAVARDVRDDDDALHPRWVR